MGAQARRAVTVKDPRGLKPINFENEIIPIFTKHSCNSGGCHGKAEGQNGFKLSLLGFDASFDYESIVTERRGRRICFGADEHSLRRAKPAGQVPHGGGLRIKPRSDDYQKLVRWIQSGLRVGNPVDPKVTRVEVQPGGSVLERKGRQQLAVTAIYSDGRREDVTRLAQYESNDKELAEVTEDGAVTAGDLPGET